METKTPTLKSYITDVPDFPKKGIIFKDLTSLLESPAPKFYEVAKRIIEITEGCLRGCFLNTRVWEIPFISVYCGV